MSAPVIMLGQKVEITNTEARSLRHLGEEMHRSCIAQKKGWFLRYLTAHREAHAIIKTIMERSHASS